VYVVVALSPSTLADVVEGRGGVDAPDDTADAPGTTTQGERVEVRGCDLFEFRGDKVAREDSY
jgi:hypothetical protein